MSVGRRGCPTAETVGREEGQVDQVYGEEAVLVDRGQDLEIAGGQEERDSSKMFLPSGKAAHDVIAQNDVVAVVGQTLFPPPAANSLVRSFATIFIRPSHRLSKAHRLVAGVAWPGAKRVTSARSRRAASAEPRGDIERESRNSAFFSPLRMVRPKMVDWS